MMTVEVMTAEMIEEMIEEMTVEIGIVVIMTVLVVALQLEITRFGMYIGWSYSVNRFLTLCFGASLVLLFMAWILELLGKT